MLGCDIAVVNSVDRMPPILMDFMPLGSAILALFHCLLTMIIGSCKGILLVLKLLMEPLREVERTIKPNSVRLFLK